MELRLERRGLLDLEDARRVQVQHDVELAGLVPGHGRGRGRNDAHLDLLDVRLAAEVARVGLECVLGVALRRDELVRAGAGERSRRIPTGRVSRDRGGVDDPGGPATHQRQEVPCRPGELHLELVLPDRLDAARGLRLAFGDGVGSHDVGQEEAVGACDLGAERSVPRVDEVLSRHRVTVLEGDARGGD